MARWPHSARANRVAYGTDVRAYLHLATNLLVENWAQSRLRDLLPDRLAQSHPELVVQPDQQSLPDVAEPPRLSPPRCFARGAMMPMLDGLRFQNCPTCVSCFAGTSGSTRR